MLELSQGYYSNSSIISRKNMTTSYFVASLLAVFIFASLMATEMVESQNLAPNITVVNVSPQTYEIKYTDDVMIEVVVANDLMINWTINGTAIDYYNTTLVYPVFNLQEDVTYVITLTVTDTNSLTSSTFDHPFKILKSSRHCNFNVTPTSGFAFDTEFSHVIENCRADHLRFSYFFKLEEGIREVHHENVSNDMVITPLPFGNQSEIVVGVEVMDSLTESSTIYTYPVVVEVPSLGSFEECKILLRSLGFKRSAGSLPPFKYVHVYSPHNLQLAANECARLVVDHGVSV
ncbi:hypothetical protein C9374_013398 [Naegleria lovaniensis]|uniref:PKD/REJ-like domain-containing protein n=1 Tax=Naegleria lovaniensis TaxID=51637 RepID=A0AA88KNB4_NAELO|nr:uncharacterized protein C9374_013398 [Naegleria lovaniensis]KAG2391913.1 hypothetical protein C9374_013398 [Naegleria lovaniensis]